MNRTFSLLTLVATCVSATALAQEAPAFDLNTALQSGPPMTADRAAELALQANPSADRVRALARASEASVARARAQMWPRLELSGRYTHIDGFPDGTISAGPSPQALTVARDMAGQITDPAARAVLLGQLEAQANSSPIIKIPRNQIDFGAQLTWPVSDMFFAMLPALKSAKAAVHAEEARIAATEAQIRRDARQAFYQLARARGALAVATEAENQANTQLGQVEASVRAGYLTESDLLDARARVAATGRALASANAGVEIADAALRTMFGAPDGPVYGIAEQVFTVDQAPLEAADVLLARALKQRPEIAALQATTEAQNAAVDATTAQGYPHVALIAGANYANPNRYVIPPRAQFDPSWQVGAAITWSPNDTLINDQAANNLRAQTEAVQAQLQELKRGLQLEIRRTLAQLNAAKEAMVSAESSRTAAEAAYQSRLAQLKAGHSTSADLVLAEVQLDQARLSVLDAAIELRLARTNLAYATGSR
ncbi:MAG TPA: TolC family protein [Polyangiales bacterium]|nr:TolC family protein [Polyangiales bacterium]